MDFTSLPPDKIREVLDLAANGQRYPDEDIATAADRWADQVLAHSSRLRLTANWVGALVMELLNDSTDDPPGWEHRMAKTIKQLPTA